MPPKRSALMLLTSHWVSVAGAFLVTLAGISWLFLLPVHLRGRTDNPYVGLLVFLALPVAFFLGLALIPIGIALAKRRGEPARTTIDWRKVGIFFGVMTAVNVVLGSQLSYRAVEYMDTVQFCGQSCHVMTPEFTAHQKPPHNQVSCAECHVAPGASGWVAAKSSGTRQLMAVIVNNYPRPIESAIESNRLVSSAETCERCHARDYPIGDKMRILPKFKDDEANTRTWTVLLLHVGGGAARGIHSAHIGPGISIQYAAQDKKRDVIPWVEYTNSTTRMRRAYTAPSANLSGLPRFEMQCVDCHNRPAHTLQTAERALDQAFATNRLPQSVPYLKKTGLALLLAGTPGELGGFYQRTYPDAFRQHEKEIASAAEKLQGIYRENVFPDLKVTWNTYPNRLGHIDNPGCFRCHDDSHSSQDKKTITQDCAVCHQVLALEETDPDVLKPLNLVNK